MYVASHRSYYIRYRIPCARQRILCVGVVQTGNEWAAGPRKNGISSSKWDLPSAANKLTFQKGTHALKLALIFLILSSTAFVELKIDCALKKVKDKAIFIQPNSMHRKIRHDIIHLLCRMCPLDVEEMIDERICSLANFISPWAIGCHVDRKANIFVRDNWIWKVSCSISVADNLWLPMKDLTVQHGFSTFQQKEIRKGHCRKLKYKVMAKHLTWQIKKGKLGQFSGD